MKIDHEYTDEIVCPYCGDITSDSCEYDDNDGEIECEECGKTFRYSRNISVDYCSNKDCELNKEEHKWRLVQVHPSFDYVECTVCGEDGYNEHPVTKEVFWTKESGVERVLVEGSKRNWMEDGE